MPQRATVQRLFASPRVSRGEAMQQLLLPLDWRLPGGVSAAPLALRSRRPAAVVARGAHRGGAVSPRAGLPDPTSWAAGLVTAVIEVRNGDRPPQQLVRWLEPAVYQQVVATRTGRRGSLRPAVRSVHLCEPRRGVVEAAVLVGADTGARAIALRLEATADRWRCTYLAFV